MFRSREAYPVRDGAANTSDTISFSKTIPFKKTGLHGNVESCFLLWREQFLTVQGNEHPFSEPQISEAHRQQTCAIGRLIPIRGGIICTIL